jgi:hypothetical protein
MIDQTKTLQPYQSLLFCSVARPMNALKTRVSQLNCAYDLMSFWLATIPAHSNKKGTYTEQRNYRQHAFDR